jgi:flagellin
MTVINTNIAAQVAANAMQSNSRAMEVTMERLATGMRINSAGDDAAGLAIGVRMEAQIRGLEQATRNANDAISLIQTVDGAATEIGDMLQRMRELAVQARNETNETSDKTNLDKEFTQLATEIDRIANDTKFNGTTLMNSGLTKTFTVGADEGDKISVTIGDFNLAAGAQAASGESLGSTTLALVTGTLRATGLSAGSISVSDGSTVISVTLQDIQNSTTSGGTEGTDVTTGNVTTSMVAKALNDKAQLSAAFTADIAATAAGVISFTEKTGSGGADDTYGLNVFGTQTSVTSAAGTPGTQSGVLVANLSSYSDTNVTVDDAGVINALDNAIVGVAAARADYGSVINRLEHTVDNLNSSVLNTTAAQSAIMDADYAAETTELARTQIISQASTAMLSPANQQQQSILALLK